MPQRIFRGVARIKIKMASANGNSKQKAGLVWKGAKVEIEPQVIGLLWNER